MPKTIQSNSLLLFMEHIIGIWTKVLKCLQTIKYWEQWREKGPWKIGRQAERQTDRQTDVMTWDEC